MSLSFPASPTTGTIYAQNGRSFRWSGYAWELVSNVVSHAASHGTGGSDQVTIAASQVSDFAASVVAASPATTDASLLTSGSLSDARLSASVRAASSLYLWSTFR